MLAIKIDRSENGYHANQRSDGTFPLLPGWAVVPESLGTMQTLENFPYGDITVADVDGVPTVTGWTPLPMPEPGPGPEPEPEPPASLEARVDALETETAAISAAIERGLSL